MIARCSWNAIEIRENHWGMSWMSNLRCLTFAFERSMFLINRSNVRSFHWVYQAQLFTVRALHRELFPVLLFNLIFFANIREFTESVVKNATPSWLCILYSMEGWIMSNHLGCLSVKADGISTSLNTRNDLKLLPSETWQLTLNSLRHFAWIYKPNRSRFHKQKGKIDGRSFTFTRNKTFVYRKKDQRHETEFESMNLLTKE